MPSVGFLIDSLPREREGSLSQWSPARTAVLVSLLLLGCRQPQQASSSSCTVPVQHTGQPSVSTPPLKGDRDKRKRATQKDFEDRGNASFHTHWRHERDLRSQPAPPAMSASERLRALRDRVLAKRARTDTLPVT